MLDDRAKIDEGRVGPLARAICIEILLSFLGQRPHLQVKIGFSGHETVGRHTLCSSQIRANGGGRNYEL